MKDEIMKEAILFFYTSSMGDKLHPFLLEETKILSSNFDLLHIICLDAKCGYKQLEPFHNVTIHPIKRRRRYTSVLSLMQLLVRKEVRLEINRARHDHILSVNYIKELLRVALPGFLMFSIAKDVVNGKMGNEICVESYWFDASAYAAARLKEMLPESKMVTRAHGIEIDPVRNVFTSYELKNYCYSMLDSISFISDYGKGVFLKTTGKKYGIGDTSKLNVFRLGVEKKNVGRAKQSCDGALRIVTCSRIESVKRIPLLIEGLKNITDIPVIWTHFGDGSEFEKVKESAKHLPSNIKVFLKGNCSNETVHQYYSSNSVDVFINVSFSEGIPVSIMEAFAYGIPCIATDVGGTSELVNKSNGILIHKDISPGDLASNILDYYVLSSEKKREMGDAAIRTWSTKYNSITNQKMFIDFLKG